MIEDLKVEIKSKLELGEEIEEHFILQNYEFLEDKFLNDPLSKESLNKTFGYGFIITNRRIFIGDNNMFFKTKAYDIYDRDCIRELTYNKFKQVKKFKFSTITLIMNCIMYGMAIFGGTMLLSIGFKLIINTLNFNLHENVLLYLSIALGFISVYGIYKIYNKVTTPKYVAKIILSDEKELNVFIQNKKRLRFIQKLKEGIPCF